MHPPADHSVPPQNRADDPPDEQDDSPPGCRPIATMRVGWFYRQADRMVLHRSRAGARALQVGEVPRVVGKIAHLTDDGEYIRIEYQVMGRRQRRPRIVTEDELDRGTWASKCGQRRPSSADARQAFAVLIREQSEDVPEVPARSYYAEDGELIFPDADAQTYGYGTRRGSEEEAREAWEEIASWAALDPKTALTLGAYFAGPILDRVDMLAHVVNLTGKGQRGKSTALTACAALFGDVMPRRQQLMMSWNSSKQGHQQGLRGRGFLPLALDEHSSSGRTVKESSREISQIVAGCIRAMGGADGSPRESDGFWHSILLSSSNAPLKFSGQTEDLATRLQEIETPFWPNQMVDPSGDPVPFGTDDAEHVAKRLKRLAGQFGGWPLHWAREKGMYRPENLDRLGAHHRSLCAAYGTVQGGIPATITELHMAWVMGAEMLADALGVPDLAGAARDGARARLDGAVQAAEEANVPDGERLWLALDALRIEASAFPEMEVLPRIAEEGFRRLSGFHQSGEGLWWVTNPVLQRAAAEEGVENVTAALHQLDALGVHLRGSGSHAQRFLPKALRERKLGNRMHCFDVTRAAEAFPEDGPGSGPRTERNHPEPPPEPPRVVPVFTPVTCTGTTGTTGTTPDDERFYTREGSEASADVPALPRQRPAAVFPEAPMAVTDREWLRLEATARGRAASALRLGVLGADGLHLPNRKPVVVPLPGSVDEVPALMAAYQLRTLYLHADVLPVLGLPAYDPWKEGGPQAATACAWATLGTAVERTTPEGGVSCWMTLYPAGEGAPLNLAIPAYEDRMDLKAGAGRGGFGGAPDAATLLDALILYTLSTRHGTAKSPKVIPYYLSPNRTGEEFAGGRGRREVLCEAVRRGDVAPVATPTLVSSKWHRAPEAGELAGGWVHRYDKSAAYLGAFSNVLLGIGEPEHDVAGATAYDPKRAGWWRVRDVPGQEEGRLPGWTLNVAEEGGYWVSTPCMELLRQVAPDWEPDVAESWSWPTSTRALSGMYELLRISRERLLEAMAEGRPGAVWAKQVVGKLYQSFRGYLGRKPERVQRDHVTGAVWDGDVFWRPDWAKLILAHAMANTWRNMHRFAQVDGRYPVSLSTDAVTYFADTEDPEQARPASMVLGSRGGQWTHEGGAPVNRVRAAIEDDGAAAGDALSAYLNEREG